jgi:hypothetical protein
VGRAGDNALTGTYNGKQAVGELWGKLGSKEFSVEPHDFIAEGDKVVVLTTNHLEGETIEDGGRPHLQRQRQAHQVRHARRRDRARPGVRQVARSPGNLTGLAAPAWMVGAADSRRDPSSPAPQPDGPTSYRQPAQRLGLCKAVRTRDAWLWLTADSRAMAP